MAELVTEQNHSVASTEDQNAFLVTSPSESTFAVPSATASETAITPLQNPIPSPYTTVSSEPSGSVSAPDNQNQTTPAPAIENTSKGESVLPKQNLGTYGARPQEKSTANTSATKVMVDRFGSSPQTSNPTLSKGDTANSATSLGGAIKSPMTDITPLVPSPLGINQVTTPKERELIIQMTGVKRQMEANNVQIKSLTELNEKFMMQNQDLSRQVAELQNKVEQVRVAAIAENSTELEAVRSFLSKKEEEVVGLAQKIEILQTKIAEKEDENSRLAMESREILKGVLDTRPVLSDLRDDEDGNSLEILPLLKKENPLEEERTQKILSILLKDLESNITLHTATEEINTDYAGLVSPLDTDYAQEVTTNSVKSDTEATQPSPQNGEVMQNSLPTPFENTTSEIKEASPENVPQPSTSTENLVSTSNVAVQEVASDAQKTLPQETEISATKEKEVAPLHVHSESLHMPKPDMVVSLAVLQDLFASAPTPMMSPIDLLDSHLISPFGFLSENTTQKDMTSFDDNLRKALETKDVSLLIPQALYEKYKGEKAVSLFFKEGFVGTSEESLVLLAFMKSLLSFFLPNHTRNPSESETRTVLADASLELLWKTTCDMYDKEKEVKSQSIARTLLEKIKMTTLSPEDQVATLEDIRNLVYYEYLQNILEKVTSTPLIEALRKAFAMDKKEQKISGNSYYQFFMIALKNFLLHKEYRAPLLSLFEEDREKVLISLHDEEKNEA